MDAYGLRQRLADKLVANQVLRDKRIEGALRSVERHVFAPGSTLEDAYEDRVIRLKEHGGALISSLSQPTMIVEMLQQLDVRPGNHVLEIGTGSGFTSALISKLTGPTGAIVTIDIEADLVEAARERYARLDITNITARARDGAAGCVEGAPYDRILLTVCASDIEGAWWDQLADGGKIVLPLSLGGVQKSIAFIKREGTLVSENAIDCAFVMLRGAAGRAMHARAWSDPDLFLQYQDAPGIDLSSLGRRLATEEPLRHRIGHGFSPRDFERGGALWVALHDSRFCRLDFGENTTPARIGLCERDAIALLDFRQEDAKVPTLFITEYGNAQLLAQRLDSLLHEWDDAGRPGRDGIHVIGRKATEINAPSDATAVLERPVTRFEVWMR